MALTADPQSKQWTRKLFVPFVSLENRNFRLLWLGQLGAAGAMWAEQIARSWLTWQLTESATALGLVNLFRALPLITLGLLAGVVADRYDKRKVLMVIQLWSLAIYIVMAVLILGGWIRLWHIYVTALLLGSGMAMNQPVRTSLVPQLVPKEMLVNAISLNSLAINVTRLIGPAVIGFLIAAAAGGVGPAYVVSSVLYTLIIVSTSMIDFTPAPAGKPRTSVVFELAEGFRYMLMVNRTVLALVIVAMGPLAFAFSYATLLPVFVTEVLHMGPSGYGSMQSVSAIGGIAGGLTIASLGNVPWKGRIMLGTGIAYGALIMVLGILNIAALAFGLLIVTGACQTLFRAANNSTLLEITPTQLQGRIVSMTFLDTGMQSIAAILAGTVTDAWGVSAGMAVIGGICVAIVGGVAVFAPAVRRL